MDEGSLTNEVSRVDDTTLTESLSQPDEDLKPTAPTAPTSPPPPSTFTFPTLALDGSLPDLTADVPVQRHHTLSPIPPATLSSPGAKTKMADIDNSSETSLDAQYDMMDDISEISNDDHETASLVSTEREDEDGQMTPEESIVDLREAGDDNEEDDTTVAGSKVIAENQLLDSYMSEQLETPRQSAIRDERHPNLANSLKGARRVLFLSDKAVGAVEVSDICLRIASCLNPEEPAGAESTSRVIDLPLTQTRVDSTPALFVRVGEVELLVEPCSGLESCDDVRGADFAVLYRNKKDATADHLKEIKRNLLGTNTPIISIVAPGFDQDALRKVAPVEDDLTLSYDELFEEDTSELRSDLRNLVIEGIVPEPTPKTMSKPFNIWDYCPLDGLYNDNGRFTWQEFVMRGLPILLMILAAVFIKSSNVLELIDGPSPFSKAGVEIRRQQLGYALAKVNLSPDSMRVVNVDHLLPHPIVSVSSAQQPYNEVRYQGIPPNHILVSLPRRVEGWAFSSSQQFPTIVSTNVYRTDTIDFNQTRLIDGIFDITIPTEEAYGVVTVNITTKLPQYIVPIEHDFGNRLLRRKTYEKAGMELSKAVNKDVAVARKNVKSLGGKIGLEWAASATATKNVTSELAVYIARDLQILANTAISVIGKAAAASNETAATLKKELVLLQKELTIVRKDLVKLTKDVQKSVIDTAQVAKGLIPSFETLKKPLVLSKQRAGKIGRAIAKKKQGRKEEREKSASAGLGTNTAFFALKPTKKDVQPSASSTAQSLLGDGLNSLYSKGAKLQSTTDELEAEVVKPRGGKKALSKASKKKAKELALQAREEIEEAQKIAEKMYAPMKQEKEEAKRKSTVDAALEGWYTATPDRKRAKSGEKEVKTVNIAKEAKKADGGKAKKGVFGLH